LISGVIVFLVALPLCLGIALASNAPLFSGLVAGIVGGILVGALSGTHTGVSGPAAGLTAIVAAQIATLGSFEAFLLAVIIGGLIQILLGLMRAGALSAFFPSSVIKGLLAAIGVILILKQIPHVFGHDRDPEGEMSFTQPDHENTFSELLALLGDIHPGATVVGLSSIALLILWDRVPLLKKSIVPGPLVVVLTGVGVSVFLERLGGRWIIGPSHLVQVPVSESFTGLSEFLSRPDWSQIGNPAVYLAGVTIAIVASLETLLNLEAVDKIDPQQRQSPPNRELLAQGVGNVVCGLFGGLPVTSVIVRGSVNIMAGAQTKLSAIFHGTLLLASVAMFPTYINRIPLACLAAILLVTGYKLASPKLFKQMAREGRYQLTPFVVTLVAIVLTDLLIGILIGLAVAVAFILNSNLRRPVRRRVEKHLCGEVLHIELSNQVSFLNRAALERVLREVPRGGHVLLDAGRTDYIDPDVLSLIRDFKEVTAPVHGVYVSLSGFRNKYRLCDSIEFVDYSTRELQEKLRPEQVLEILREGNARFRTGQQLQRDFARQVSGTAGGQHPIAVVLSCIDSRTPSEIIFDLGLGDIFSVRVAGNVTSPRVLGSMEYGCAVAGARLVLVMGHTRCGAVTAAVQLACVRGSIEQATGCQNLEPLIQDIQHSVEESECRRYERLTAERQLEFCDEVARRNVLYSVDQILRNSGTIRRLVEEEKIALVGAVYDVNTGGIEFLLDDSHGLQGASRAEAVRA
jgi:carbonic anhydrase/SulP family sulfate permease